MNKVSGSIILNALVVLLVAGVHASAMVIFVMQGRQQEMIQLGSDMVVLTVHPVHQIGDSAVESAAEIAQFIEPEEDKSEMPEAAVIEEIVEKKPEVPEPDAPELIAAHDTNKDALQAVRPIEKKAAVVQKSVKKTPEQPVKKPQRNRTQEVAQRQEKSTGQRNSQASLAGSRPLISQLSLVRNPRPQYPRSAQLRKQTGKVIVMLEFDERGIPITVHLERSSGIVALDDSAIKAAKSVRSKPYYVDGKAIPFKHRMVYEFNLT